MAKAVPGAWRPGSGWRRVDLQGKAVVLMHCILLLAEPGPPTLIMEHLSRGGGEGEEKCKKSE